MFELPNEIWAIVDWRTGEHATVAKFLSRAGAMRQLAEWKERDKKGIRQDVSHLLPFLEPKLISVNKIY